MREAEQIPQPKTYGLLGNLPLIDKNAPTLSLCKVADEYGPIFRFKVPGFSAIIVTGHELVAEICDTTRFDKSIEGIIDVRAIGGDGLFTSRTEEPNWRKAHNILLSTFSKQSMEGYHAMMVDIALQLINKWERLNPNEMINVPDDMTRLTLDTIGLCGFNYRFNSYYRETHNPFIISMVRSLNEAMLRGNRLDIQNKLMFLKKRQFDDDLQTMFDLVDKIIAERKSNGNQGETDLLSRMLNGRDPETGETLDDENIRYQIITFLIAGHETTSGLLSFALYFLMKNPDKLKKAYEEVDQVLTTTSPSYSEVLQLKYIRMVLNEALRLWPTAPAFGLYAREDTIIGGKYFIKKGEELDVLLPQLHRDKDAWGDDAEAFRPERFEDASKIPYHAYKPFGNGERACIGMQFALHEATLVLAMILQKFKLIDHLNYQLNIEQTLTLKPGAFQIQVEPRDDKKLSQSAIKHEVENDVRQSKLENQVKHTIIGAKDVRLLVLYGSDLGMAEGIAQEIFNHASTYGFKSEIALLNDYAGNIPKEGTVIIVTSTYNGKPPHNAKRFVQWLETLEAGQLAGVNYAVFGCGDRNWINTYQDVPRFIDEQFSLKGATRISPRGEADASGDMENQVDVWQNKMWSDIISAFNLESNTNVETKQSQLQAQFVSGMEGVPLTLKYNAVYNQVTENRELQSVNSERSTRHIDIALPNDVTYQEGDHLGVLPSNSLKNVNRILQRFNLRGNDQLILTTNVQQMSHLPLEKPISLHDLLSYSVEVQEAATRAQLRELIAYTDCPPHKRELEALLDEDMYQKFILQRRVTMLDLLEKYEACGLPFVRFLELLPPLKPRYYSISSSSKVNPRQASITVGVVRDSAWNGNGEYRGVASNYLAESKQSEAIVAFIRTPESGFQLPESSKTPIIMVGPGTGIAPFRGFLQARAEMQKEGEELGEAHLYFGCRNEDDFLYREELEQFEKDGIVTLRTAFSRVKGQSKQYVQHLMEKHATEIINILTSGGKIYICGDGSKMAVDVESTLIKAYEKVQEVDNQTAIDWLDKLENEGNYVKDVWVSN